jgi:hypothetical protein
MKRGGGLGNRIARLSGRAHSGRSRNSAPLCGLLLIDIPSWATVAGGLEAHRQCYLWEVKEAHELLYLSLDYIWSDYREVELSTW